MNLLENRILAEGKIFPGNILKVDSFLNHQIDPILIKQMGKEIADHFMNKEVTKVVTIETSGIAIALTTAFELGVPMVFAKKNKRAKYVRFRLCFSCFFIYEKNRINHYH